MKGPDLIIPFVVVAIACFGGGVLVGIGVTRSNMQREAISRGHTEYVLVNNGPQTKFVWKEGR